MACCVLMAATWCAALGFKAWWMSSFGRADQAQAWRLTPRQDDQP